MAERHSLLKRQLKKYLSSDVPPPVMRDFIDAVDQAYRDFDEDRRMLERSMEISSQELYQANAGLKEAYERLKMAQTQLVHSEKMSAVGQLAAGIAHEINNPLGVILGFAQALVKRLRPMDPLEMPLKSIEREARRCKELVQNLLVFSRTGKSEKEKIDVNETVQQSLSLISAQAKVRNVDLAVELDRDVPPILANSTQVQQIIINLCNNAIDSMRDGGRLTVKTVPAMRDGVPAVEILVTDTGHGIPKEIQSKIFEPFFTTKEVGKGTGLGLSLVFEVVQKHAGCITLDSEPGKGTTFRVCLPVSK